MRDQNADNVIRLREKLPAAALRLLDCEDGKATEWGTATSLARYGLHRGLTEDEFVIVVSASDFAVYLASENGRDRSHRLESRLRKAWHWAEETQEVPLKQGELRPRLAGLLDRVAAHRWTGRSGASQRAVALAVVSKGYELNVWTVDASTRDVALAAGVSKATAARALRSIAETGLWTVSDNGAGMASTITLDLRWNNTKGDEEAGDSVPETPLRDRITHPVFLRAALGPTAERLWFALSEAEGGMTVTEAVEKVGASRSTTQRTLKRLADNGMAVAEGHHPVRYTFVSVDVEHLDRIADEFGVLDWEDRTADRIKREREGYAKLQEQRRKFTEEQDSEAPEWAAEASTETPEGEALETAAEPADFPVIDPFEHDPLEVVTESKPDPFEDAPVRVLVSTAPATEPDWEELELFLSHP